MTERNPTWWRVAVDVAAPAEDAVSAMLERLFRKPATTTLDFESGRITVAIYTNQFPRNPASVRTQLRNELRTIASFGLDVGSGRIAIEKVAREDWRHAWKKHFKAFEIGRHLLIRPSWSKRKARRNQRVIVLDPGLSFGTGHHATTRFCLEAIAVAAADRQIRSMLDIGTGTGILAIAAAKLGCRRVEAFDIDPVAVRVAQENACRNRARCFVHCADVTRLPLRTRNQFDLVCANLIDTVLIKQAARIVGRIKPGGRLVLAGILDAQFKSVAERYARLGWQVAHCKSDQGWTSALLACDV